MLIQDGQTTFTAAQDMGWRSKRRWAQAEGRKGWRLTLAPCEGHTAHTSARHGADGPFSPEFAEQATGASGHQSARRGQRIVRLSLGALLGSVQSLSLHH